jgi:exodeoxyribonuclease VII large subunit
MASAQPKQVLTVTELTRRIKGLLEESFPSIWVEGEISNLRMPASGHMYFTLKDAGAQLAAVLFRGVAGKVGFKLKDGLQVIAFGDVSVYEKQGQYQIIVRQLLPKGLGALQLAFEELKQRLAKEGLFDPARKKPIPTLPQRIGLVTSPTGAAIRDFLNIIGRRFPNVHIVINPVRVQGEGAAEEIAAAIDEFNALAALGERALPVDVIIVMRGGGSLEDLWAFNEEVVARALARSKIPTISAVGHEIDFTISDFVADLRAPTPSAAAELVVKAKQEFVAALEQYQKRLAKDLRLRLQEVRQRFSELAGSYVFRQPAELVRQYQQQVDDLRHRLAQATGVALGEQRARLETAGEKFRLLSPQTLVQGWRQRLATHEHRFGAAFARFWEQTAQRLEHARGKLDLLSPRSTLERGYSITRMADGRLVKKVKEVKEGDRIRTMVADGEFGSVVS